MPGGKIIKSVGGFYHVKTNPDLKSGFGIASSADTAETLFPNKNTENVFIREQSADCGRILVCRARGLFRLKEISPCAGDDVEVVFEDGASPVITEIHERRNALVRPPLANLDCAVIVVSALEPKPSPLIADKLVFIMESKGIEPVFVFTKTDKGDISGLSAVYKNAGFTCFEVNNISGEGLEEAAAYLKGKTSALIGNTGVGKTSFMNRLIPGLDGETAAISKKLGRGKHTTRTVELFTLPQGGYCADTPGFSTVDGKRYCDVKAKDAALYFREIKPLIGKCAFAGCAHVKEEGCAVISAVEAGTVAESRWRNYVAIYGEMRAAETAY